VFCLKQCILHYYYKIIKYVWTQDIILSYHYLFVVTKVDVW